jgi:CheY-like chemotaxis protein
MSFAHFNSNEEQLPLTRRNTPTRPVRQHLGSAAEPARRFSIDQESYTSGQAARLLRIPSRTLRRYLSLGKIRGEQNPITQTWHISSAALADFIESQGGEAVVRQTRVRIMVIDGGTDIADKLEQVRAEECPHLLVNLFEEVGDALIESGVNRPDLIVINTTTPFFDGIGLLRLLRANAHLKSSKILAITEAEENINGLAGMRGITILKKPFSHHTLVDIVSSLFPDKEVLSC